MLCTKSPNKFKYADNFDDEFADVDPGILSKGAWSEDFSWPRKRSPFAEDGEAIPEACAVTSATESAIECECPCESSSPLRTRNDFSMTKNAANPTKIPNLCEDQSWYLIIIIIIIIVIIKELQVKPYPISIFRFSSTITKWMPEPWCSPMKECGTRWRKTSERRPPV